MKTENPKDSSLSAGSKKLGVIILNWNGLTLLKKFIPAAARFTICDECDLIVADNGSDDSSLTWLRANYPDVRIIELCKNYGFAEGYNRAIAQAEYQYVCLLNSDVEVTPDWWRPLLSFLEANPDVGAVQPKILSYHDKTKFEYAGAAGGYLDRLGYPYCRGRLFDSIEEDCGQYDGAAADIAWASGACIMLPRTDYLEVGGLDARFFAHMEEIDLCWRLHNAGKRICAVTDAAVYHVGGATLNQGNPQKTYLNFRNNLLLLHKNLPAKKGKRILFWRRLADTLAFAMFLVKGDAANAGAILKAHRDFRKMRRQYSPLSADITPTPMPGTTRNAVIARYILRHKQLRP